MIVLHTALVFIFIIRGMHVHQQGYTWLSAGWHKSWCAAAVVTNTTAIIGTIARMS